MRSSYAVLPVQSGHFWACEVLRVMSLARRVSLSPSVYPCIFDNVPELYSLRHQEFFCGRARPFVARLLYTENRGAGLKSIVFCRSSPPASGRAD